MIDMFTLESSMGFISIDLSSLIAAVAHNSRGFYVVEASGKTLPCKNKREAIKKIEELKDLLKKYEKNK